MKVILRINDFITGPHILYGSILFFDVLMPNFITPTYHLVHSAAGSSVNWSDCFSLELTHTSDNGLAGILVFYSPRLMGRVWRVQEGDVQNGQQM